MSIIFRQMTCVPLESFDAVAPDGAVIGIIGEDGSGKGTLLRLAAGAQKPTWGSVEAGKTRRLLGPNDTLNFAPVDALLLDHALARHDPLVRARSAVALDRLRRSGTAVLLVSHEDELLTQLCDEIWWLQKGKLAGRGDPAETLRGYHQYVAQQIRAWGESVSAPVTPRLRRGDGRAEVVQIEMLGEAGKPTIVWRSGELAMLRVTVRFKQAVADPVIGMIIRNRVGLNVYGTNTELEKLRMGPCAAGDTLRVSFGFRCELFPQEYTLTVASHDPDGVWHDWLEDAVAFSVTDQRYTAGVSNLRASASFEKV